MAEDKKAADAPTQEEGEVPSQVLIQSADFGALTRGSSVSGSSPGKSMSFSFLTHRERSNDAGNSLPCWSCTGTQRGARLLEEASLGIQVDTVV